MSGRGRGRSGGGRGQPHREQQSPAPSSGRDGGRNRRGGRSNDFQAAQPPARYPSAPSQSQSHLAPTSIPSRSQLTSSSAPSPSGPSLTRDVEKKLTLGSPAPAPAPLPTPVQPPTQPKSVQAPTVPSSSVGLPPTSSKALSFPARPGYGTVGRKCLVRANHFLVEVADRDLNHYDVSITPEVSSKKVCRDIMNKLVEQYRLSDLGERWPAYDGRKSIYTAGSLPFSSKEFNVLLDVKDGPARKERKFKVAIKFAAKADLFHLKQYLSSRQRDAPQETIQVLDVVLRAAPSNDYTVVGRSFFAPKLGDTGELGNGLQYWKGFYQSLRPTQMGLSLNIDMSARAFFEPILVSDFVAKYFYGRDLTRHLSDQDRVKVKRALKGVKVEVTHREHVRRYRISGISMQPTSQLTFQLDDTGAKKSIVQYFRERYNINLRYAHLPALQAGSDAKPIYLPMEVCKIVEGQRYSKKLNEKQVTALLRATCQRPAERENSIKKMVANNNYNRDKFVKEFGLQVGAELTSIDARVLPPPTLKYHDTGREKRVDPSVGQWNMINKKMVNGGRVEAWACVNFSSRTKHDLAVQFCQDLVSMCIDKGIDFNSMPLLPIQSAHPGHIEKALFNIHTQSEQKGKQLQLLIIILPDVSGSYGRIKRVCETELGIVSQCCQPRQVSRLNKQYLENVSLKINVKAGGRNTKLLYPIPLVTERPMIIFGADVTHPQPGEDSSPSIAAVVASMDWPEITKYRGLVSAQPHREEIIQDLYKKTEVHSHGGMIRELLIAFWKSTKHKPERIIFYRDGVSEGQFNQVLLLEVDAIRKACVSSGNILPGTVVDTKICNPSEFDFYLCSHAGIQGTSRPAHYHVLYDENNFTADALQILTNNLCYTYARCTRSVSIVPPAYYAHLAAFRARYYIEGDVSDSGSGSASGGIRATRDRNVEVRPLPVIKDNVKDVMFYC
ncbi:hypothetical protein F0562_001956 [Nyssa sinensis]|uniref:Piwi domain-containing protein n=1 Tax=Nyssa sinensis TaxID=561372 RepID=A0A5J5C8G3_9ASTE|nr:hypothetical protein F0562_001956 [Nyssa sinensis]